MEPSNTESGAGVVHWLIGLLAFLVIAGSATFLYLQTKDSSSSEVATTADTPAKLDPVLESSATLATEILELNEAIIQIDGDYSSTDDLAPTL